MRYQPILHTLYYTLHTEHAYCLSYRFLNNIVITTVIEMVEMVEILNGRLGKRSVERVKYVINNLLHLVIVKYGDISLILCIFTRLWLVTILSLLMKYLVILHADLCNKSYIYIYIWTPQPITLPCSRYTCGVTTCMPTREKKLDCLITTVEYGQIFHITSTGKYYSKNMKYRINTYHNIHVYMYIFILFFKIKGVVLLLNGESDPDYYYSMYTQSKQVVGPLLVNNS